MIRYAGKSVWCQYSAAAPGMAETAQALGGSLQDIVRQDEFYGLTAETISTILKGKYAGDEQLWDFRTIM